MLENLLTPEEAADRLAVTPKTVRKWLRAGLIKGAKAGRLWRLSEEDIHAFLVASPTLPAHELETRVRSVRGMLAGSSRSADDFLREKHEETRREECLTS